MQEKRKTWEKELPKYTPSKMVFLDESGVNTDMARRYAYAMGGSRAVDAVPVSTPTNTTILSSISKDGTTVYTTYQGGTTSERFKAYLKDTLIPKLDSDSLVVMDNMRSHHTAAVKAVLEEAKIQYVYLPPYSPDLNPIEKMWSKVKAFLRKKRVRKVDELDNAIKQAFQTVSPNDCSGWFRSCGYSR